MNVVALYTLLNWIDFWQEDPNFHQYLRSQVIGNASTAVLGDYTTAAQFQVQDGQLVQMVPDGTLLYAVVEGRANSSVMKLGMSWSTEPASGSNAGTFVFSGDSLEWSIPTISRPQDNVGFCVFACLCSRWQSILGLVGMPRCWRQLGCLYQPGTIRLQHTNGLCGWNLERIHRCNSSAINTATTVFPKLISIVQLHNTEHLERGGKRAWQVQYDTWMYAVRVCVMLWNMKVIMIFPKPQSQRSGFASSRWIVS